MSGGDALRARAESLHSEAAKTWGACDTGDGATHRVSAKLAGQINKRTDRAMQRCLELTDKATTLEYRARRADRAAIEAARVRLTADDVRGATHVSDRFGWHRVVKVNVKSVTVETPWSGTDRIALDKVHAARRATT